MAKKDVPTDSAESTNEGAAKDPIAELTAKVEALTNLAAESQKQIAEANERVAKAEQKAAQAALGLGNDLRKLNAFRMPPNRSHVVADTKSDLPSGNTIVNA